MSGSTDATMSDEYIGQDELDRMSAAASTNSIANPDVKETKQRRKPEASSRDLHTGGFSPVSKATEIPRGKEQVTFKKPAVPSKRFQVSHSKAKPKEQTNTTASKKPKSIIAPKLGSERVSKRRPLMAAFRTMPSTSGTAKSTPKTGLERPSEGKTAEHAAPKTTPATTSLDHRQSLGQGATKAPSKAARKQMMEEDKADKDRIALAKLNSSFRGWLEQ